MYPHQIRLAGPWEELTIGGCWSALRRRFGRPRQIDEWERVWLVPSVVPTRHTLWRLNGANLAWTVRRQGRPRAAITDLIKDRNELIVRFVGSLPDFRGARLEIGCRAEIGNVRTRRSDDRKALIVSVELASECGDDPLELYALIDGETFAYRGPLQLHGSANYELRIEYQDLVMRHNIQLQVDLICRSAIWDRLEKHIELQ